MSTTTRFAIRSTRPPVQKEGNKIIYGTGDDVPFRHTCELFIKQVTDTEFEYITGLEPKHITYSNDIPEELKPTLLKRQAEAIKVLIGIHGKDTLRPTNKYFWEPRSSFKVDNETLSKFFDTKEPEHLLLYWKIMGGGYDDAIGLTYDVALSLGIPFYMTEMEEEAERRTEDISLKVKAFSMLEELSEKKSTEDMLWLAWMLHPNTMGYTHSTPKATLYNGHYEFIEGRLVKKSKKSCPKQFIDACNLLKSDKTRIIASAIVKAGEYFGLVYVNKENKYQTRLNNTILADSIEESIEVLLKPGNLEELELLREEVEKKIK